MDSLNSTAPAFIEMANRIVWATVATVDRRSRPRTRVMQPIWVWDLERLVGWIATSVTPVKTDHLEHSPFVSVNYWAPSQDAEEQPADLAVGALAGRPGQLRRDWRLVSRAPLASTVRNAPLDIGRGNREPRTRRPPGTEPVGELGRRDRPAARSS